MSLFKTPKSPYYQYGFQMSGRRYYGSTKCTTKQKAEIFERRLKEEIALGGRRRSPITVDEACGLYQDKAEQLPSWPTIRYMLRELVIGLGRNKLLSEVSPVDLQRFFSLRAKGRAAATVNREIDNARAVWRLAKHARFDIGEEPAWRSLKRKESKRPPRELELAEEPRLMTALRSDIRDAVEFMLMSGWRRNEVLNLRWGDCNFSSMQAKTRIKGGDVVMRPLTKALCGILKRQPKVSAFVFTYECQRSNGERRKGERYPLSATALRKPFAQALKAANIDGFRLHDLRHTRGTRIVRATGSIAAAKEALKHSSINTTLRYSHVLDEDVRQALEASESRNSAGMVGEE